MDVHLVVDPWTRESRGFGFVTMATLEEADRCIKHLNNSVIEGRVITVEKVIVLLFSFLLTTCCWLILGQSTSFKIVSDYSILDGFYWCFEFESCLLLST